MARTVVTTRTAAGERQSVRDMGTCLLFDGVNDIVTFTDSDSLDLTDTATWAVWMNPRTSGENSFGRLFDKGSASASYILLLDSTNKNLNLSLNGSALLSSNNAYSLRQRWQHIVVTYDKNAGSSQVKFYVNGVAAGTRTYSTSIATNTVDLFIGNRLAADRTFDGYLDEARIYNRALTATEVSDLFYGREPSSTGLVLNCKFDEGSGTAAIDSSGVQSNGVISGATYSTDVLIKLRTAAGTRTLV